MQTALFYDTETTGVPVWNSPSEDPCQPHIIQIAAELCDESNGKTIDQLCVLVQPDGWEIPDEIVQLTGITNERAARDGVPIQDAMRTFLALWRKATFRIGHNESFDMRMVRIEMMRQLDHDDPFHDQWKGAPAFCTQSKSTKIVNLPPTEKMLAAGRKTPKSPTLSEAYRYFTGNDLADAHDTATDVMATKAVYYGIKAATGVPA